MSWLRLKSMETLRWRREYSSTLEVPWILLELPILSFAYSWSSALSSLLYHLPAPPKDRKEDSAEMFKMIIERRRAHNLDWGWCATTRDTDRCHLPSPVSKYNCLDYLLLPCAFISDGIVLLQPQDIITEIHEAHDSLLHTPLFLAVLLLVFFSLLIRIYLRILKIQHLKVPGYFFLFTFTLCLENFPLYF